MVYEFINDGRLPEEQPGQVWSPGGGERVAYSAFQAERGEEDYPDWRESPPMTNDDRLAAHRGAHVLSAAVGAACNRLGVGPRKGNISQAAKIVDQLTTEDYLAALQQMAQTGE